MVLFRILPCLICVSMKLTETGAENDINGMGGMDEMDGMKYHIPSRELVFNKDV